MDILHDTIYIKIEQLCVRPKIGVDISHLEYIHQIYYSAFKVPTISIYAICGMPGICKNWMQSRSGFDLYIGLSVLLRRVVQSSSIKTVDTSNEVLLFTVTILLRHF